MPFLIQKFGGRERVEAIWTHICEVGATLDINYQPFKKTALWLVIWLNSRWTDPRNRAVIRRLPAVQP